MELCFEIGNLGFYYSCSHGSGFLGVDISGLNKSQAVSGILQLPTQLPALALGGRTGGRLLLDRGLLRFLVVLQQVALRERFEDGTPFVLHFAGGYLRFYRVEDVANIAYLVGTGR